MVKALQEYEVTVVPLIENFGLTISDLLVGNSVNVVNEFSLLIKL